MSKDRIRVGVFGVGSLGQHHARIYGALPGAELVGVFDTDFARARQIAERHGTRAFDSLEALAEGVQAASVVVPTDRHRDVGGRLLEAGLHLLVEKPISATGTEAEELVGIARSRDLILQVGHVERFNPVLSAVEERAGAPRFIEAHRLAPYPPPRDGAAPRGTEVSVVLDLMIHDLEIMLHLVRGRATAVHAVGVPVLSPTEDIANVRLVFENGCVANITASRISPERMRKIRVFYDDAYLSLDYLNQAGELHRRTPSGIERTALPIEKGEPLRRELEAFVRCVRNRGRPVVGGREAADALMLAVHILERLREGPS